MFIVKIDAYLDGSRDNQTIDGATPETFPSPEGWAVVPDTLDTTDYYAYNGFVILTIETIDGVDTVTSYVPNVEAWEEWKASLPEVEEPVEQPTQLDRIEAQVTYTAMMTDTLLEA